MINRCSWRLAWGLLLLLGALCGCALNPVTGRSELMLLSEQDERQIGVQTRQSVIEEYGAYDDAALQGYVNGIAQPLARVSHRPVLDWQFQVMDSPVVNAFAAPGGYVFITRGLLAVINDEAELAGVLAHEIGHVTARHSARNYSQSLLTGLGLQLGTALAGSYGQVLGPLLEVGTGLLFLKYSRDDEREADALGVEYATKAGYDTNRMADFFTTLQRQETLEGVKGGGLPEWFSTHPSPVDREAAVRSQTTQWRTRLPHQTYRLNRDAFLARIDGLIYGEDPRQGFREGEWFYLPQHQAQFRIPAQWAFQREGNQV
ncbi:MAG: M48 family metalloprotease, partial [Desulfuromonadales bacterium]